MLQPDPALRPSAQQVLEVVAREEPAVAATTATAVEAAAEAAAAQAVRQAVMAAHLQQGQQRAADVALVPSPFASRDDSSPPPGASPPGVAAAAAEEQQQFSFDVPQQQGSGLAFTPGQPLRSSHVRRVSSGGGGMPPGSAVKGTPMGRSRLHGGHPRWAPALSPLISEGALTPGAAAALAGLTPQPRRGSSGGDPPTPELGYAGGSGGRAVGGTASCSVSATPLDVWRPAPLQVPPQAAAAAIMSGGSSGMMSSGPGHPGSGGTQDSRDGWHLSRRDIVSPDSDFFGGETRGGCAGWAAGQEEAESSQFIGPDSRVPYGEVFLPHRSLSPSLPCARPAGYLSESDYSYSCGTGRTTSDMDFADALSPISAGGWLQTGAWDVFSATAGWQQWWCKASLGPRSRVAAQARCTN